MLCTLLLKLLVTNADKKHSFESRIAFNEREKSIVWVMVHKMDKNKVRRAHQVLITSRVQGTPEEYCRTLKTPIHKAKQTESAVWHRERLDYSCKVRSENSQLKVVGLAALWSVLDDGLISHFFG